MPTKRPPNAVPGAEAASSMPITRPAPPAMPGPATGSEVRIRARLLRIRANGQADLQLRSGELLQVPADAIVEE